MPVMLARAGSSPLFAQDVGRPQDGVYSGQSNGQVDLRGDGRASHKEGLPPKRIGQILTIEIPISPSDCDEVDAVAPDGRPGWQSRVRGNCPLQLDSTKNNQSVQRRSETDQNPSFFGSAEKRGVLILFCS